MSQDTRERWRAEYLAIPVELRLKAAEAGLKHTLEKAAKLRAEADANIDSSWLARRQLRAIERRIEIDEDILAETRAEMARKGVA